MNRRQFWVSSAERALKTFAQSVVAVFLGDQALNVLNADWGDTFAVAATATLLSFLTSIASSGLGPDSSPSLVGEPAKEPDSVL